MPPSVQRCPPSRPREAYVASTRVLCSSIALVQRVYSHTVAYFVDQPGLNPDITKTAAKGARSIVNKRPQPLGSPALFFASRLSGSPGTSGLRRRTSTSPSVPLRGTTITRGQSGLFYMQTWPMILPIPLATFGARKQAARRRTASCFFQGREGGNDIVYMAAI